MKSYEEVTNNLLKRRERYITEKNRKIKRITMVTGTSFCGCCLVALMGVGVWQSGIHRGESHVALGSSVVENNDSGSDIVEQQTSTSNVEASQNPNIIDQTDKTAKNNEIRILEIEELPSIPHKMFFALMWDDFISMDYDEINEYYGVDVFPAVPSDLESKDNQILGIYKRRTNGELYYDGNKIQYANADFSRCLAVNVDKDSMPFDFCNLFANIQTRSIVKDVEVGIAQTPIGELYAEFMYQNVGFRIYAFGLTQDEFVTVIESLLD